VDHRVHAEEKRVHRGRGQAVRGSLQHGTNLLAHCTKLGKLAEVNEGLDAFSSDSVKVNLDDPTLLLVKLKEVGDIHPD